ncbi:hypothetical protein GCM10009534_72650 [Kribbella sandramycini]
MFFSSNVVRVGSVAASSRTPSTAETAGNRTVDFEQSVAAFPADCGVRLLAVVAGTGVVGSSPTYVEPTALEHPAAHSAINNTAMGMSARPRPATSDPP